MIDCVLALARRRQRKHYFFQANRKATPYGFEQLCLADSTLAGEHQHAAKDEVAPAIGAGALDRGEVLVFFYQHQLRIVAFIIRTVITNQSSAPIIKSEAFRALTDTLPERSNEFSKFLTLLRRGSEEMEDETLSLPWAYARQMGKCTRKFFDVIHVICASKNPFPIC